MEYTKAFYWVLTIATIIYYAEIAGTTAHILRKYRGIISKRERPQLIMAMTVASLFVIAQALSIYEGLLSDRGHITDVLCTLAVIGCARVIEGSVRRRGCFYKDLYDGCWNDGKQ